MRAKRASTPRGQQPPDVPPPPTGTGLVGPYRPLPVEARRAQPPKGVPTLLA